MSTALWKTFRIGDLGGVITGRTPPTEELKYFGDFMPFITPTDMGECRIVEKTQRSVSKVGAELLQRQIVPEGVVLTDPRKVDKAFLYYAFSTRREEFFRLAAGGSRTPILRKSDFERLPVVLPPLPEQRAIASILGALDDKIELNRRMNATLEAMARAIFKSWFVDFDPVRARAEGRETGLPAKVEALFPDTFWEVETSEIPQGWRVASIGDISRNARRTVDPDEMVAGTPYIGLEHMPRKSIALIEWTVADKLESNKNEFRQGEILFGKLRPYFH